MVVNVIRRTEDQAVSADAVRPVAKPAGQFRGTVGHLVSKGDQEVVTEAMVAGQVHRTSLVHD